jgi:pyruvate/2-oxoglutarate dehydrogenase complex dihydrolipoamide dehydrogenase (E3) component
MAIGAEYDLKVLLPMIHDRGSKRPLPPDYDDRVLLENVRPPAWRNPRPSGKYSLVIIGAGPAGLVAAHKAAAYGAKVALIERDLLGGECLNTGCIPSKTIIRTSRLYADMRNAENFGARAPGDISVDFPFLMERIRHVRARIGRLSFSARGLAALGVDVYFGDASFVGPSALKVNGATLRFKKALIATGSRPLIPSIPGLAETGFLTNENVFDLAQCPRRLLVIGGGPLGCELAQAFCRLGSQVTIVQDEPMFLRQEERDAAQILSDALVRDGIDIHLNTQAAGVRVAGNDKLIDLASEDNKCTVAVDQILVGVGQTPNVAGLNLDAVGVKYDVDAGIQVNDFLQTTNERIYAAGDVCFEHTFTHIEDASARIVVQNALFQDRKRLSALAIPWCTYTDPEIAHVGMYVRDARDNGIPVKTFTVLMHDVHRAIADAEEEGFVKISVKEGTDKILGATVVARHAGEMINDISLAMTSGTGLRALAGVIHPYPTQAQAIKMAADACSKANSRSAVKRRLKC